MHHYLFIRKRCQEKIQLGTRKFYTALPGIGIPQKKPLGKFPKGFLYKFRRRPTLPRSLPRSTIGAEELNFRVRNGNGCGLLAIVTGKLKKEKYRESISKALKSKRVWPSLTTD
jgi:hypothetical protein